MTADVIDRVEAPEAPVEGVESVKPVALSPFEEKLHAERVGLAVEYIQGREGYFSAFLGALDGAPGARGTYGEQTRRLERLGLYILSRYGLAPNGGEGKLLHRIEEAMQDDGPVEALFAEARKGKGKGKGASR